MGYFINDYIKEHAVGKTILNIISTADTNVYGQTEILFTDGTYLKLTPHIGTEKLDCGCEVNRPTIIVNPHPLPHEVKK
jgi:tRNA U34 5-carboxymethylaminomethyl modifying enzyme MnmG/GidA